MNLIIALQTSGGSALIPNLVFMGGLFAVAYFFFIRPQAKKQGEQAIFIDEIKKGDLVVTSSGIIGKIDKIDSTEATIQTTEKSYIRVTRGSISKELTDAFIKVD